MIRWLCIVALTALGFVGVSSEAVWAQPRSTPTPSQLSSPARSESTGVRSANVGTDDTLHRIAAKLKRGARKAFPAAQLVQISLDFSSLGEVRILHRAPE